MLPTDRYSNHKSNINWINVKISWIYKSLFICQVETADGSGMEITEYFGGAKKCFSFKYNQEFDYDRPGMNLSIYTFIFKLYSMY